VGRLRAQLRRFEGRILEEEVTSITRGENGLFELALAHDKSPLLSRTVLLCTGVRDRMPEVPGVDELCAADLLRQCPICDGHEYSGKRIGVLGDSDHADREAEFLRTFGASVAVVRLMSPAGAPVAVRLAAANGAVCVTLSDGTSQRFDVLYAALGVSPQTSLASSLQPAIDEEGNIVVDAHCRSSISGLYAAGDVVSALDQIAVAFGHGAIAATAVHNALRSDDI